MSLGRLASDQAEVAGPGRQRPRAALSVGVALLALDRTAVLLVELLLRVQVKEALKAW